MGVSDIQIDPFYNSGNNLPIIYVASGDAETSIQFTAGIYRSMDGGNSWSGINGGALNQILQSNNFIWKILIDPTNTTHMYAATSLGIFKCTNRQAANPTWTKEYPTSWNEEVMDLEYEPGSSQIIYAAGRTVIKSADEGDNWASIAVAINGLDLTGYPDNSIAFGNNCIQKINLELAGTSGMYVLINVLTGDCPVTWNQCAEYRFYYFEFSSQQFSSRYFIFGNNPCISYTANRAAFNDYAVSPTDPNDIIAGAVSMYRSFNGGTTTNAWGTFPRECTHVDIHYIKYDPFDSDFIWICSDGGVYKREVANLNCTEFNNGLQISTVYNFNTSYTDPYQILIGTLDDGAKYYKNSNNWITPYFSDNFEELIDRSDNNNMLSTAYSSMLRNLGSDVNPNFYSSNVGPALISHFGTAFNIVQDPLQNNVVYYGKRPDLWKNTNFTHLNSSFNQNTWQQLTDFLNPPYNVDQYQDVISIKIAPSDPNIMYLVHAAVYDHYNQIVIGPRVWKGDLLANPITWNEITPLGVLNSYITDLEVSESDANHIWITFSGYDPGLKIKEMINGSWFDNSTDLPNLPINCIEFEPGSNNGIYVGTDAGVYYKNDFMSTWASFNDNCSGDNYIPNTVVKELEVNLAVNKIRAGTFGRSMWESDLACPIDVDLTLNGIVNIDDWKEAQDNIFTTQEIIYGKVNNRAGVSVQLEPGFVADPLTNPNLEFYKAFIHACIGPNNSSIPFRNVDFVSINESIDDSKVNEIESVWNLNVRPNPAYTSLEISILGLSGNSKITVHDILGNLLYFNELVDEINLKIDINDWNSGIFVVEVIHSGSSKRQKVVKL